MKNKQTKTGKYNKERKSSILLEFFKRCKNETWIFSIKCVSSKI